MAAASVQVTNIGLEAPYQLGKVERAGKTWKAMMKKAIVNQEVRGLHDIKLLANEMNAIRADMARIGGFSQSQWCFGNLPRRTAGEQMNADEFADVGAIQARVDGQTEFARKAEYREECKKAFVQVDSSKRVASALLRKAAPLLGTYKVGNIVAFQREQGSTTDRMRWHPGSRIIGFDGRKTCWVINGGVPFCVSLDRIRPCTSWEALSFKFLNKLRRTSRWATTIICRLPTREERRKAQGWGRRKR